MPELDVMPDMWPVTGVDVREFVTTDAASVNGMELVQQMLEVFARVGVMGEMVKKQVYHDHPFDRLKVQQAIWGSCLEIGKLETLWMAVGRTE